MEHHLGEDGLVEGTAGRGPRVHGTGREQRTRRRAGIGNKIMVSITIF